MTIGGCAGWGIAPLFAGGKATVGWDEVVPVVVALPTDTDAPAEEWPENAAAATAEKAAVIAMEQAIAIRVIRDTRLRPAFRYPLRPRGFVWLGPAALIRTSLPAGSRRQV